MKQLLTILLIPFFVLGQALPHSHAGSGMVEPGEHADRPHWHLFSANLHHHDDADDHDHGHGHDHHHGEQATDESPASQTWSATGDHDSDAIYVTQSNSTLGRSSAVSQQSFANTCEFVKTHAERLDRQLLYGSNQMPDRFAGLPIYLLVASLRL